ncbi:MAG: nuclear transport factor 2 family protein [Pseudomonadota bacterium]
MTADQDAYHTRAATLDFWQGNARIEVVHPFNSLTAQGFMAVLDGLATAFEGLHRRDDIVMAGKYDGADWMSATGYYAGRWVEPWIGLKPSGELAYLRHGEFHRMADGKAAESYVFFDIPELMIATGQWPIDIGPGERAGYRGRLPGPATQDGLAFARDARRGADSAALVTDMLRALNTPDEAWRRYWHDDMAWYGPGAFGSFLGIEAFRSFQVPFESQFEGWSGGSSANGYTSHFTRFGDGDYVCSGGWPSVTGVNVKPFLGLRATGERVLMRVCDWWRRDGDLLAENWVFVDVPHLLLQLGRDVLADSA